MSSVCISRRFCSSDCSLLLFISSTFFRFSIETASCAQKAAISSSSCRLKRMPLSLLISWITPAGRGIVTRAGRRQHAAA
eukprot:7391429-Prymnesium_polylepis.2